MGKKFFKMIFLLIIIFGVVSGIYIAISRDIEEKLSKKQVEDLFTNLQNREATIYKFYTYGTSLNLEGSVDGVNKENLENVKLVVTDGENEFSYDVETAIENKLLIFKTPEINNAINLDKLDSGNYYIFLRVKLNNSKDAKYYTFKNNSEYPNIEYYTITKNNVNNEIKIEFLNKENHEKKYNYLSLNVFPIENVECCDFVIDAGHGGNDSGEKLNGYKESDITLDYAKDLKNKLEEIGLKIKLTRDDSNNEIYTSTNMYNDNGRISIACETKAKYMFSFHVNNGANALSGLEIYAPTKSNLKFAKIMAKKIVETGANSYSNNSGYRKSDGVFVWNFTTSVISKFEETALKRGYDPYNITVDTPYQYTIREVGGIATNAYVDGRNIMYAKNKYYNSNQGIECYQIELGYIKNDLEKILYNKEAYISAIVESIKEYLKL